MIDGIGSLGPAAPSPLESGRTSPPDSAAPARRVPPAPAQPAEQAPPGVDPALFGLLTEAERAFFAQQAALGPLTYGASSAAQPSDTAPLGQRIDVRA